MTFTDVLNLEIVRIIFAIACVVLAYFKGRRMFLWGFLGYSLTIVTLPILALRKTLPRRYYPALASSATWLAERYVSKRMKDIQTPDDFLREAEGKDKNEKP
jgi:hypothetical protein